MSLKQWYIDWCRQQQAELRREIERLESGRQGTFEFRPGGGRVDTTAQALSRWRDDLVHLEQLAARAEKRLPDHI